MAGFASDQGDVCGVVPPAEEGEGHGGRVAVGLEDGRVVVVDVGSQGRYAVQRDCHAGPTVAAQWIRCGYSDGDGGGHELWTLGEGRLWRWRFLALPEDREEREKAPATRPGAGPAESSRTSPIYSRVRESNALRVYVRVARIARRRGGRRFVFRAFIPAGGRVERRPRERAPPEEEGDGPFGPPPSGGRSIRVVVDRALVRRAQHTKRVTAVRWHPRAAEADDEALFPGWLAATSKDGSFLVYDGGGGVVRSPPSCRQALNDVAWAPGGAGAVAATAGQDGLVRVVDVSFRPSLRAVMRGHDGSVLCVCWARVDDAGGSALLSGSDDRDAAAVGSGRSVPLPLGDRGEGKGGEG